MDERRETLRILRVTGVVFPDQFNAKTIEFVGHDVVLWSTTRDIEVCTGRQEQVYKLLKFFPRSAIVARISKLGRNAQKVLRDRLDQILVKLRERFPLCVEEYVFKELLVTTKEWGPAIMLLNDSPMFGSPVCSR